MAGLNIIKYFLWYTLILICNFHKIVVGNLQVGSKSVTCHVKRTFISGKDKTFLNCEATIIIKVPKPDSSPSCEKFDSHSMRITSTNSLNLIAQKMVCVSNSVIFVNIHYPNGEPNVDPLHLQWNRAFTDFYDPTSYTYELVIKPPADKDEEAFKYSIFTKEFSKDPIQIMWFNSPGRFYPVRVFLDHQLDGRGLNFTATKELINIPCAFPGNLNPSFTKLSIKDVASEEQYNKIIIPVDNKTLSYHALHGFTINTTLFSLWEGSYICEDSRVPETVFRGELININPLKSFSTSNQLSYEESVTKDLRSPFFNPSKGNSSYTFFLNLQNSQFIISCTSKTVNVTFKLANAFRRYPNPSSGIYEIVVNESMPMKDVTYSHNERPESSYTATVVASSYNMVESVPGPDSVWPRVFCWDTFNNEILHSWDVVGYTIKPNSGKKSEYVQIDVNTNTLECSLLKIAGTGIDFRQIKCNDPTSCKNQAPTLFTPKGRKVYDGSPCYLTSRYFCKTLQVLNKGFFQCTFHSRGEFKYAITTYQSIYFVAFDEKLYVGNEEIIPDEAIMKVELLNRTQNTLPLPGKYVFACEAHSFYFEHGIQWFFGYENRTQMLVTSEYATDISTIENPRENVLRISSILLEDSSVSRIRCAVPTLSILNYTNRMEWKYMNLDVYLKDSIPPTIHASEDLVYFRIGEAGQILKCQADGFPTPEVRWTVEGKSPELPLITNGGSKFENLQFPFYNESFAGKYVCTASNMAGQTSRTFTVNTFVEKNPALLYGNLWIIIAVILFSGIIVTIPFIYITIRRLRVQVKNLLTDDDVKDFVEGTSAESDDKNNVASSLPYNESYEITKQQFEIDRKSVLGRGEFGIVYSGTVSKPTYSGSVAFKTVSRNCNIEDLKALLSELKIMIYVGDHENIIRLIGAYTKEIKDGIVYVATELCSLGSLEGYLRENKGNFTQTDVEYINQSKTVKTIALNMITKEKLCIWSSQIANGMDYMAFKHVVHSDLATRNILLTSNEVVKIADFGLSRKMYNYCNYKKANTKQARLPWRWMAIECLTEWNFSTQSDVWAYGITLWEIFSLGSIPYPGISWTVEFLEMLEGGLRCPKPKYADANIYNAMLPCWNPDPRERPLFSDLKLFFRQMASEKVKSKMK